MLHAGTCTIDANQAGNANYNAAPQVSRAFTIAKGNQTITFGALAEQDHWPIRRSRSRPRPPRA